MPMARNRSSASPRDGSTRPTSRFPRSRFGRCVGWTATVPQRTAQTYFQPRWHHHTQFKEVMEVKPDLSCLEGKPSAFLPGTVDKNGHPIILVVVPQETGSSDLTKQLQYLLSIFSESTRSKGYTAIVDARKGSWKHSKSYVKQVEDTLKSNEIRQLIIIKPDGFWDKQRVENCTSSHKDHEVICIPRSRINKFVDQSQLPTELGGSFVYNHDKWMENRKKVEEFYKDAEMTIEELQELHQHMVSSRALRASQVEEAITISSDMTEATKMLVHNVTETGKELVQNIEYENRTRKLSIDNIDKVFTPQDTLDTIEKIHQVIRDIKQQQQLIETAWIDIERDLVDTKDLNVLKEGVDKVTNWILGPAEKLLNSNQKVGYDVTSAEELRRDHEAIEFQCWEAYGSYAELLHKINLVTKFDSEAKDQHKDLISQKEFMDFVCKSFALRLERRRNVLITSQRFFRLVSEYFDKTGEVFDSLVMGSDVNDFKGAGIKLKKLQENQAYLDSIDQELRKEGEKLSDMLSMPVKDSLGQEINTDYSEDIVNIKDVLDATVARKNIFSDSVELQKLTLQQVTLIDSYEKDAEQAVSWLGDILKVMLRDHGHVGCSVYEIQSQKEEHQMFQETAKDAYNYGCQLLNASLLLRQSCKLPLESHNSLYQTLKSYWDRILCISQEQMTRLRVSAVFYRSIEEQCNQIRDMREAVATIPLMNLCKKRVRVQQYFEDREKLMVEVGRMVRLGKLLRSRLREPLYEEESFFIPSSIHNPSEDEFQSLCQNSIENNEIAIEAISEKLAEVTQLSEELDQALKSAQQDCIVFSTASTSTTNLFNEVNNNYITSYKKTDVMDVNKSPEQIDKSPRQDDSLRSDEEFHTASDTTLQHSRSSSYNTASECEQHFSPWWQYGKDDMRENIAKEKMVLAVGCPPEGQLPPVDEVLKPSPDVPPGKIVREVTETTHFKVHQQHSLGVKSFVLTSETVRDKNDQGSTTREESIRLGSSGRVLLQDGKAVPEIDEDELLKRMKEVGVFEREETWNHYSSYRDVTKQTIKNFMLS
ncbi:hypothetical protein GWI33_005466 [Rhynchophorus ferrugineus]|uniref:CRAL-TRIO domain-containing protein n=1 Tax=Rhynchophorus ferrugineus TaxID=354439 RepID=A0A834ILK2_RHYFE|nr:hypothetical protein GWI33_005466 [Rhynchophorus ferrugineus]